MEAVFQEEWPARLEGVRLHGPKLKIGAIVVMQLR
jgi:hypothetical protein